MPVCRLGGHDYRNISAGAASPPSCSPGIKEHVSTTQVIEALNARDEKRLDLR